MLLLKILALESMNGFAVSQRLKQVCGDVLGRRAKYYSLARLGRQLEKEADN